MTARGPSPDAGERASALFIDVLEPGPYASIQDLGRPGLGELGVSPSGACDRGSLRLANRLLGNSEGAAAIEATMGGLEVRAGSAVLVAVTGAPAPVTVDGQPVPHSAPVVLPQRSLLRLGSPDRGLRTYVAVRGGLVVDPVLGSCSTDVLSGLGPRPLSAGQRLPLGRPARGWHPIDVASVEVADADPLWLRIRLGPRADWFTAAALGALRGGTYEVTSSSNRVGLRLTGPRLEQRAADDVERELPSEGVVAGALQVPPDASPVLLLADHPVTGGYPVIAVVLDADLDLAGQARPGQRVRFRVANPPGWHGGLTNMAT